MHPVAEDLELFALKELAPTKSSLIEAHLQGCDTCRKQLREREEFAWQLRNLSEPDRTAACDQRVTALIAPFPGVNSERRFERALLPAPRRRDR